MTRRQRYIALSIAVVLLMAIAAWALSLRGQDAPSSDAAVAPVAEATEGNTHATPNAEPTIPLGGANDDAAATNPPANEAPSSWPQALPDPGTSVADVFDALYARAKRGDAAAACWLGQELSRCAQARQSANYAAEIERMVAQQAETPERAVGMIDNWEARSRQLGEGCADLRDEQLEKAFELRLSAAKAKPALRVQMALNPSLDRANFLSDIDRWTEYKNVALPWLEQAARQGDASALIALARIYGDHRAMTRLNPPFRIRDDAKFVLYSDLMARYGVAFPAAQADLDAARARLSVEERMAVAREVDTMVRPEIEPLTESEKSTALGQSYGQRTDVSACGAP